VAGPALSARFAPPRRSHLTPALRRGLAAAALPEGWARGDEIVIAPTRFKRLDVRSKQQAERFRIRHIESLAGGQRKLHLR
jgi:hypothetical protein